MVSFTLWLNNGIIASPKLSVLNIICKRNLLRVVKLPVAYTNNVVFYIA